jgi:hypothetical protein
MDQWTHTGVDLRESLMTAELKPFEASARLTLTAAEQQRLMGRLQERRATAQSDRKLASEASVG